MADGLNMVIFLLCINCLLLLFYFCHLLILLLYRSDVTTLVAVGMECLAYHISILIWEWLTTYYYFSFFVCFYIFYQFFPINSCSCSILYGMLCDSCREWVCAGHFWDNWVVYYLRHKKERNQMKPRSLKAKRNLFIHMYMRGRFDHVRSVLINRHHIIHYWNEGNIRK